MPSVDCDYFVRSRRIFIRTPISCKNALSRFCCRRQMWQMTFSLTMCSKRKIARQARRPAHRLRIGISKIQILTRETLQKERNRKLHRDDLARWSDLALPLILPPRTVPFLFLFVHTTPILRDYFCVVHSIFRCHPWLAAHLRFRYGHRRRCSLFHTSVVRCIECEGSLRNLM